MRGILNFTTILVALICLCHSIDIPAFESNENDIDFDFNEIDFESPFIANNRTDGPIDKNIEEDSKLDTVRISECVATIVCINALTRFKSIQRIANR